jgi:hypothetical protein
VPEGAWRKFRQTSPANTARAGGLKVLSAAILAHFAKHGALDEAHYRPAPRGPPAKAA